MNSTTRPLTIGQAARRTGLSQKAIRLYESRGLLIPAERTDSGYRTYSQHDVDVLRFIRQAKSLGLRLEEIKEIVDLERGGTQPCDTVLGLLGAHIQEIDRTMADLRTLKKALVRARDAAVATSERGEGVIVCRIIESQSATSV